MEEIDFEIGHFISPWPWPALVKVMEISTGRRAVINGRWWHKLSDTNLLAQGHLLGQGHLAAQGQGHLPAQGHLLGQGHLPAQGRLPGQGRSWQRDEDRLSPALVKYVFTESFLQSVVLGLKSSHQITSPHPLTHRLLHTQTHNVTDSMLTLCCTLLPYGYSYKASCVRPDRQSAQMSKITNDGVTRSGTECSIAVSIWQQ